MEFLVHTASQFNEKTEVSFLSAFSKVELKSKKEKYTVSLSHWPKEMQSAFESLENSHSFEGKIGQTFTFHYENNFYHVIGLGEKKNVSSEILRREFAKNYKLYNKTYKKFFVCLESFNVLKQLEKSASVIGDAIELSNYEFDTYFTHKNNTDGRLFHFAVKDAKNKKKIQTALDTVKKIGESINISRDLVNEPPNVLHSEYYAKYVEKEVKTSLKGKNVKVKILDKQGLKKEKMGLFLSVNAGSFHGPRLIHLTYTPKKVTKNTKHVVLVGKGLTFDTGGHSLKPSTSMVNMKFDMAGSATVFGAFRAAVLTEAKCKITCILGVTDNAISNTATVPDSIIKARNGKYVEILNTDAEGRLVLADCLDYGCDLKPDHIIDCATLTGAILIALGSEVCGLFSNDKKLVASLEKSAKDTDENIWEMPIIDEYREDLKSPNADLANIGKGRGAGSSKAAAFLENFIQEGVSWAHLDIAGIGDSQAHLPYCPAKGASGIMIRTLHNFLMSK